ncbi:unnamed protein product, partial [Meganyctiphanes norvegica]
MVVINNMPYDDPATAAASPPLSSPSTDSNPLSDDDLQAAVLAHYENLSESLVEKKGIAGIMCDDKASVIGSTGLPFADDTSESGSPGISEPPTPTTSPDTDPTFTPPMRCDSCDESPSVDLKTPLKFDTALGLWRPMEEPETWLSKPLVLSPEDCNLEFLQVPPAHRALYRKHSKVCFDETPVDSCDGKLVVVPPTPTEKDTIDELPVVGEEDESDGPEEGVPLLAPHFTGANGNIPQTKHREETILNTATCTIKVPMSQRKPSLSNINLPCYRRRPSGQALDINFDYTFTVVSKVI